MSVARTRFLVKASRSSLWVARGVGVDGTAQYSISSIFPFAQNAEDSLSALIVAVVMASGGGWESFGVSCYRDFED